MSELLWSAADFPDPFVRLPPDFLQMLEERELRLPSRFVGREAAAARLVMDVHDLAKDVELKLAMGGIADAHWGRILVAGQPRRGPFRQPPLAGNAVHDLQLTGAAGHRSQQPFAPSLRFVEEASVHG